MNKETLEKAEELQDKIIYLKNSLVYWSEYDYGKALKVAGNDIKEAVNKLFTDKVNEKIAKLQKEFEEL